MRLLLLSWCLWLGGCVAHMERQARDHLTGDPGEGGGFGYSQELADRRSSGLRRERDGERAEAAALQARAAALRSEIASLEGRARRASNEADRLEARHAMELAKEKLRQIEEAT